MTDYQEEQRSEIEALESIYIDEMEVIETLPFHSFNLTVISTEDQSYGQEEQEPICVVLGFTYTAKYPDEAPKMEVQSYENIEEFHANELLVLMQEQAEENLGMVMVFTIVSAVQECLHDIAVRIKTEREDEIARKKQELEEEEMKRFEGIRVTIDSFMAWKNKFDAEMDEIKMQQGVYVKAKKGLTGREMFLQDPAMDDSDVNFLEDGDAERVDVDESLFQDLEDLDLDLDLET